MGNCQIKSELVHVNPAIKSAFTSAFEAFFIQLKNGNHFSAAEATFIFILSEIEIR
ncbi:hypothetical protein VIBNISFn27_590027 [Vibrio nigripulchritudo SFn27]|uniref:Uncharacterized protein n=1 Tax=Vibrio nigripulchritudo TaxID=28173 RepID=U4KH11_9VIBR|nr:hypothetical protein VIBNIBLFn1_850001 [Vibrio nigripulchritudo BLFn1]CCN89254.1 hypothetical protein VIBNISFn27_590027 [Vibrio nigripulchritudo SFn27]CCN96436.1 hypothetical protein VIBNIENn2_760009 [Vibrio nigripulchritudo ENn2]CCO42178.1 hypothetical protein VIBNISFn135_770001 [Vibrio nigripulchritudo SFn135]CCO52352.1 hypothetical protein VIBNIWn13_30009 [Vibrio nigripulchritudo Wn13]CCO60844.1 hypothetical protein VIBNI_B1071 [Vibrio nigripulchritudo]